MNILSHRFVWRALLHLWLIALVLLSPVFLFAQKHNEVTVVATVIGVEVPETGWAMHFENLKIFYVRVDRVEKGKLNEKYLRVVYGHNPSSNPSSVLPEEMFEGKFQWRFQLSSWNEFDSKVIVSREEDRFDTKSATKVKGSELVLSGAGAEKELIWVPGLIICLPVKGYETEAISMERLGVMKGYWLSFENKNGYTRMTAITSK